MGKLIRWTLLVGVIGGGTVAVARAQFGGGGTLEAPSNEKSADAPKKAAPEAGEAAFTDPETIPDKKTPTLEPAAVSVRTIPVGKGPQTVSDNTSVPFGYRSVVVPRMVYETRVERVQQNESDARIKKAMAALKAAKNTPAQKGALEELKTALVEAFSRDLERREKQVSEIEARIKPLREQIEKRKKYQDQIIDLKLQTLRQEADGLEFPGLSVPLSPRVSSRVLDPNSRNPYPSAVPAEEFNPKDPRLKRPEPANTFDSEKVPPPGDSSSELSK